MTKEISDKKREKLARKITKLGAKAGFKAVMPMKFLACPKAMAQAMLLLMEDALKHDPALANDAGFNSERTLFRASLTAMGEVPDAVRMMDMQATLIAAHSAIGDLLVFVREPNEAGLNAKVEEVMERLFAISANLKQNLG